MDDEGHNNSNQSTRPVRTCGRPKYLEDYDCSGKACLATYPHPLTSSFSFDKFTSSHKAFLTSVITNDEPHTFTEAMKHSHWREAMAKEIKALESNNTWDIVSLPKGKSVVGCKWVYKNKFNPDGSIERRKARLVRR